MTQEKLNAIAASITAELAQHQVEALVVIIPGSKTLYGSATVLSDSMSRAVDALGLVPGVRVRTPHQRLGLVTFDYRVPARV